MIGFTFLVIYILIGIFHDTTIQSHVPQEIKSYFAIVPHFTLQEKTIESFYAFLQKKYAISPKDPLRIVLISPDHFDVNTKNINTLCHDTPRLCYKETCIPAQTLPFFTQGECFPNTLLQEHGLGEQFRFIQKFFPQAKILPIVLTPRKFADNDALITALQSHPFVGTTLFLASVDFSHYTDEAFAALHDKKTFYTLNSSGPVTQYASLEVDCPSCLHVINTLAQQDHQYPQLFLRDSSSTIAGRDLGTGNTSRQFISYSPQQQTGEQGFTLAFFGDTIFDRQVSSILSTPEKIDEYFKTFFQKEDPKLALSIFPHRKLWGIDFVGLNLETPTVPDPSFCQTTHKTVNFCSQSGILPSLKAIGFTLVNLANNHSMDGWTQAHLETIQQIKNNGLNYIGYVRNGAYFEHNYVYKTRVRGMKVARQGFDFTITPRGLFSGYCAALKKNKADGYVNVVSAHRWIEYQSTHNAYQESLGKQLIDCGADIIIGTHPHVIQDIQRYQGKPIIYSLWNFLFDMKSPPATMTGGYVLIDYHQDGKIDLSTWVINASVFSQRK